MKQVRHQFVYYSMAGDIFTIVTPKLCILLHTDHRFAVLSEISANDSFSLLLSEVVQLGVAYMYLFSKQYTFCSLFYAFSFSWIGTYIALSRLPLCTRTPSHTAHTGRDQVI